MVPGECGNSRLFQASAPLKALVRSVYASRIQLRTRFDDELFFSPLCAVQFIRLQACRGVEQGPPPSSGQCGMLPEGKPLPIVVDERGGVRLFRLFPRLRFDSLDHYQGRTTHVDAVYNTSTEP